jgi:hypothetical protein
MFKTWMNTSSVEIARSFGCWDVEAIVENRGRREESACDAPIPAKITCCQVNQTNASGESKHLLIPLPALRTPPNALANTLHGGDRVLD